MKENMSMLLNGCTYEDFKPYMKEEVTEDPQYTDQEIEIKTQDPEPHFGTYGEDC